MSKKALIVDDDEKLRKLLEEYLSGYGYRVTPLSDGLSIVPEMKKNEPDIVILDIMMPEKDGLEVLRDIRAASSVPVIMLTAKGDDEDRIVGLELGADDYLPKPFNPRELLARMKAVMRRYHSDGDARPATRQNLLEIGGLCLNRSRQRLLVEGTEIELSSTEYRIMEVLMTHPDRVLSRDELMNLAMGRDFMAFDRSVDVHISKLRSKLATYPQYREIIKTVWGTGYMFVGNP